MSLYKDGMSQAEIDAMTSGVVKAPYVVRTALWDEAWELVREAGVPQGRRITTTKMVIAVLTWGVEPDEAQEWVVAHAEPHRARTGREMQLEASLANLMDELARVYREAGLGGEPPSEVLIQARTLLFNLASNGTSTQEGS